MSDLSLSPYDQWMTNFCHRAAEAGALFGDWFDRMDRYAEIADLWPFAAQHIWDTDPTPDKVYLSDLERWFLSRRLPFGDLADIKEKLQAVHSNPSLMQEPVKEQFVGTKTQLGYRRKPAKIRTKRIETPTEPQTPLSAYKKSQDFFAAVARQQLRAKRREGIGNIPARDELFIGKGEARVVHRSNNYVVYDLTSKDAMQAYSSSVAGDRYTDQIFHIEAKDGASFSYRLPDIYMRDEVGAVIKHTEIEKICPGFFSAMKTEAEAYVTPKSDGDFRSYKLACVAATRNTIPHWRGIVSGEQALDWFLEAYPISPVIPRTKGTPQRHDFKFLEQQSPFMSFPSGLQIVQSFPDPQLLLSGEKVCAYIQHLTAIGLPGKAQHALHIASHERSWRLSISAEDVAPIFNGLAKSRDYFSRDAALASLLVLGARHPHWLSGAEASHLPQVLRTLVKPPQFRYKHSQKTRSATRGADWSAVKIVLIRASHFDPWRPQITPELRETILNEAGRDNQAMHYQIHDLLARFEPTSSEVRAEPHFPSLSQLRSLKFAEAHA